MGLAAIGASIMGNFFEAALLILIFAGAHFLEDYAEGKSNREISKLLQMNPTTARLITDGGTKEVSVESLKIGDKIQVLNGDRSANRWRDFIWYSIHRRVRNKR